MAHSRCVQLDILSNQLFEAYRKMNETEISGIWNSSDNGVWVAVAHLHFAMREQAQLHLLQAHYADYKNEFAPPLTASP